MNPTLLGLLLALSRTFGADLRTKFAYRLVPLIRVSKPTPLREPFRYDCGRPLTGTPATCACYPLPSSGTSDKTMSSIGMTPVWRKQGYMGMLQGSALQMLVKFCRYATLALQVRASNSFPLAFPVFLPSIKLLVAKTGLTLSRRLHVNVKLSTLQLGSTVLYVRPHYYSRCICHDCVHPKYYWCLKP